MQAHQFLGFGFFAGVIAMAVFHGLLLCGIFLLHKRLRSKANRFLALAIFGICIILVYEAADWLDMQDWIPLWFQYLPLYLRTAVPVGVFYFVLFFIKADHQVTAFERSGYYLLGLDFLLELSHLPVGFLNIGEISIEKYEGYLFDIQSQLSIVASVILLPLALKKVNEYQRFLYEHYSSDYKRNLNWLKYFLIGLISCLGLWIVTFTQFYFGFEEEALWTFNILTVGMVIILFWIGYFLMLQNNWFELVAIEKKQVSTESKLSSRTDIYYQQLLGLMSENKMYENVDLTLDQLAEKLQISSGYLSLIIKEKEHKNLFEFVNHYRVQAVKSKLIDPKYQNLTMMGVAMESGFNSRSTFHSVFKKFTGLTPSAFKKQQMEKIST